MSEEECGRCYEGGYMKRVLIGVLFLLSLIIAGCEKEIVKEYPRDGYYGRPYSRGYDRDGYRPGERERRERREYRLSDEAIQNGVMTQTDAEVQEE